LLTSTRATLAFGARSTTGAQLPSVASTFVEATSALPASNAVTASCVVGGDENAVTLMFATVTSAFDLRVRIAFAVGVLISAPVWLWQIWAFLMPGLTRKEVRYTIGFVAAAVPLFFAGAFTGWLILPHLVELMAGFTPNGASNFYDAKYYYDFVFKLLIVVGVSFVLPVFLVALNLAGVMSGKAILKGWRIAVLISIVFAARSSGMRTPSGCRPSEMQKPTASSSSFPGVRIVIEIARWTGFPSSVNPNLISSGSSTAS
jgi:Tat protein translocase TatC